jgi:hypothetical protein
LVGMFIWIYRRHKNKMVGHLMSPNFLSSFYFFFFLDILSLFLSPSFYSSLCIVRSSYFSLVHYSSQLHLSFFFLFESFCRCSFCAVLLFPVFRASLTVSYSSSCFSVPFALFYVSCSSSCFCLLFVVFLTLSLVLCSFCALHVIILLMQHGWTANM